MDGADLIEVDGLPETSGEEGSVAENNKYFLELNGTLIDGHDSDDVVRGLARLLRMTQGQAQQLIQGKPYRIRKELDRDKAEHLLAKVVACGAGAIIEPVNHQWRPEPVADHLLPVGDDVAAIPVEAPADEDMPVPPLQDREMAPVAPIEAAAGAPEELTLELESAHQDEEAPIPDAAADEAASPVILTLEEPVIEPDDEVTRPMDAVDPNDLEVEEQVVLETPAPFSRPTGAGAAENPGRFMAQPEAVPPVTENVKKKPARQPRISASLPDRRLLIVAGAALVLMATGWGALQFMGDSRPEPATQSVAAIPVDPRLATTRNHQTQLMRSVRVWMIEYGFGFAPAQVTLERLQADLDITPQEMLDGWGTAFLYQPGERRYTLTSAGPDRQFGTADDLPRIETVE